MAQLITVRLNKSDQQPLGFRLQGGKDFGTPLVVQKVNGGSAAERAGLQAGDALIRVNTTDVYTLRHQEAQDTIRAAGGAMELTVQRGGGTWRPAVTPTGSLPRPGSRPLGASPAPVTTTSLKATPQPSRAFGSGHNNVAKPFGYMNGSDSVKSIVNKQYNTPVNMYSDKTIAETLSAQTEVLAGGVLGVNFKKNEKTYDAEKSAVFKVLQEEQNDPEPEVAPANAAPQQPVSGLRHVTAPVTRPDAPINNTGGLPPGQNICEDCERLITGVFVRIKDKNLHVECFKCSTCGSSLKNQGYYNLNGKLYCDIHAKLVARQNPPAPNLDPITVSPGSRIPTNTYSTPLPPIATSNYTNGSSSMFSPSSNISGPKPFGSSIGSAYSPSLSPRSAPLSPAARPVAAPAPASAVAPPPAHAPAPALAPMSVPAPPPVAPFAPTQNVKSIVWPPPNPPEEESSQCEPNPKLIDIQNHKEPVVPTKSLRVVENTNHNLASQTANYQEQSLERTTAPSEQRDQYPSNISYSSAALSSVTSSSSKSETIIQSKQSEVVKETSSCTVKSFSAESSSKNQSVTVFVSQSNPLVENQNKCPSGVIECDKKSESFQTKEELQAKIIAEKSYSIEAKEKVTPKVQDVYSTKDDQTESYSKLPEEKEPVVSSQRNINRESNIVNQQSEHDDAQAKKVYEVQYTETTAAASTEIKNRIIEERNINSEILQAPASVNSNSDLQFSGVSLVDALTTAPDRPYSPLPSPSQPINLFHSNTCEKEQLNQNSNPNKIANTSETNNPQLHKPLEPPPIFTQQPKRGITPIPPIKTYNPSEKREAPIPLPAETKPYIPSDFKINIEPKVPRDTSSSPMIDALTTAPDRPFTPIIQIQPQTIERCSLRDALTIAPERSYSPLNITNQSTHYTATSSAVHVQCTSSDIVRPIATQTSTQMSHAMQSDFSTMQNTSKLQSSTEMSAFKPVAKQNLLPSQPEEFCKLTSFQPMSSELKSSFAKSISTKQETMISESMSAFATSSTNNQGLSSVKSAQNYFEQLDKKEILSSTAVRSKSGLHKADNIPSYQKNFDQLPSQRGITPELCNAPAIFQRPVTPTTDPPTKSRERSQEPKTNYAIPQIPMSQSPQFQTQHNFTRHTPIQQPLPQFYKDTPIQQPLPQFYKDTPISMTFQPVSDEHYLRTSPMRSRPSTPSLINKPAPIVPHYQMNLVSVEHLAPESHLYEPSSPEVSRSPTPKPRSRSPAQGPPPNPLKAHAPRIKESTPQQHMSNSLLSQATSNLRKEHELALADIHTGVEFNDAPSTKPWVQDQPSVIKEQRNSNIGYQTEIYSRGDMKVNENALIQQNYGQRQMHSQNISELGNTIMQTTKKTFEEFERTQSAKMIEIRKGDYTTTGSQQRIDSNIQPCNINAKQVFTPPVMVFSTPQQSSSHNITNDNVSTASRIVESYQPKPLISGANQGPVCDPTPSTGPSVGATPRGKTFGVSSAPKRGRGVMNKAVVPGARVPLCASCNGNIRGPFITALGRIWCPEHFICVNATCRRPLQDIGFVEENGQLYCEFCFEQYIAPACDKCHAKIKGDCLNAIGKHYHPECFNCVYCGKLFGNNPFFLEDGLPYCEADWNELFTTKCYACGFPVEAGDRWVEALNNNYHSQCFNCTVCKKNLEGQSFFAKGGRPFCKSHAR